MSVLLIRQFVKRKPFFHSYLLVKMCVAEMFLSAWNAVDESESSTAGGNDDCTISIVYTFV